MHTLDIRTERLAISPFEDGDAVRFAEIINDPRVAPMMGSFTLPYTEEQALERIKAGAFKGKLGFGAAIRQGGEVIGMVGIGGEPADVAYLLGRSHWGQGYATEAMEGFLADIFRRFALDLVEAGSFFDNPASQSVLTKLGFEKTGETLEQSKARLEPALCFKYRLTREAFANRKTIT